MIPSHHCSPLKGTIPMAANRGSKHHMTKLTEADVRAARKAWQGGRWIVVEGRRVPVTAAALARKYDVADQTMRNILAGRTWKHVK